MVHQVATLMEYMEKINLDPAMLEPKQQRQRTEDLQHVQWPIGEKIL